MREVKNALMPSGALREWNGPRAHRLDELLAAHRSVGGTARGRRYRTQQLNLALMLRLAREFQGFARDLHDETTAFVQHQVAAFNPQVGNMLQVLLTERRRLDSGNPNPGALGADFGRFGIRLWHALDTNDARSVARQRHLEHLNRARNGIAHDDAVQLNSLEKEGVRLDLATFRAWRRAADQLALQMDEVVADHLARLFNSTAPC